MKSEVHSGRMRRGLRYIRHLWARPAASHYVLLASLFFVALELTVAFSQWIVPLAVFFLIVLAGGIALVRIEEGGHFHFFQAILPIMAVVGFGGFILFVPAGWPLHLYLLFASVVFYSILKHGSKWAYPTWNWVLSTLIFFLIAMVVLGLRYHLYVPLIFILPLFFAAALLIALQALTRASESAGHTLLLSMSQALVLTQLAWVLQFLPLHFLAQAGVLVIVYYVSFHWLSLSLAGELRRQHILEYAVLGGLALSALLITSRWA